MTTQHTEFQLTSLAQGPKIHNPDLDCIRNGLIMDGVGHRAIVFALDRNDNVFVRNQISQKNTEKYYGWNAGVQALKRDDFVVISTWNKRGTGRIQTFRKTGVGLRPIRTHGGSYQCRLLDKLPKCLLDFLKPRGGGPSFLPSGYWRANYDMINCANKNRIHTFLKNYLTDEWLDYVVNEAAKAPAQHLNFDWTSSTKTKPLPATLDSHEEYWCVKDGDDEHYKVHNSMVWVLIHANGKIDIKECKPTSGHRYTGQYRRIVETFTNLPEAMPKTVVKAIQINLGAYERDEQSYGARWYLYGN